MTEKHQYSFVQCFPLKMDSFHSLYTQKSIPLFHRFYPESSLFYIGRIYDYKWIKFICQLISGLVGYTLFDKVSSFLAKKI